MNPLAAGKRSTVSITVLLAVLVALVLASSARAHYYPVGEHRSVWAESRRYGPQTIRPLVAFIATLPHGPEISKLAVYVAGPVELENLCGYAEGCYEGEPEDWMVVPGEPLSEYGSSVEEIVAHEYGHHLAETRPGGAFGTPRWDIYEHVCELSRQGALVPGNEGSRIWENPEELFAESYAALTFPDIATSWEGWSPLLQPTLGSLEMIRLDVERPWPARYAEKRLHRSCNGGRDVYR